MAKRFLILAFLFLGFGLYNFSFAQEKTESANQEQKAAIDAGNKICPVSGEKIEEKTKTTYEYEGKIYNFCCASCIDDFKKDPEKYIKKVEEELQAESKEAEQKTEMMHEGHHH